MEKILEIREIFNHKPKKDYISYDGYMIKTTEQEIMLLIGNGQSCCEEWGYFLTEDFPSDFVGSNFLGLSLTDTSLNEAKMKKNRIDSENFYEGGIMFVDIRTDKGVLQFVAYNCHNGYYGHTAKVISKDLEHREVL